MEKLDFKKADKALYSGKRNQWQLIDVPLIRYLCIEGQGAPEGEAYADALGRLYPLAYALKFRSKAEGRDFVVPPQNALWWADDPSAFVADRREDWRWKAMIRMPDWISEADVKAAMQAKAVQGVALEELEEGRCFQCLHVGPYRDEAPVLAELHEQLMPEAGLAFNGPHHEIYLSDPRRVAPEKLRTILRQPVCPV